MRSSVPGVELRAHNERGRTARCVTAFLDRRFVGRSVGGYRLESVLGQGRFGTSFAGLREADGAPVVVKKLDWRGLSFDREAVWTECAALSLLDHRGIAQWLGIVNERVLPFRNDGLCCVVSTLSHADGALFYGIVQTRLAGASLERTLSEGRTFSTEEIASIGASLIEIVAHCASRGVVHGDIRPANILCDEKGRVSLVDFGLARFFDRSSCRVFSTLAADDVDGIVETLLFLLYSDRTRVLAGKRGRPWFDELDISNAQRSFLYDAFFHKASFSSFEDFLVRFKEAFLVER